MANIFIFTATISQLTNFVGEAEIILIFILRLLSTQRLQCIISNTLCLEVIRNSEICFARFKTHSLWFIISVDHLSLLNVKVKLGFAFLLFAGTILFHPVFCHFLALSLELYFCY